MFSDIARRRETLKLYSGDFEDKFVQLISEQWPLTFNGGGCIVEKKVGKILIEKTEPVSQTAKWVLTY